MGGLEAARLFSLNFPAGAASVCTFAPGQPPALPRTSRAHTSPAANPKILTRGPQRKTFRSGQLRPVLFRLGLGGVNQVLSMKPPARVAAWTLSVFLPYNDRFPASQR